MSGLVLESRGLVLRRARARCCAASTCTWDGRVRRADGALGRGQDHVLRAVAGLEASTPASGGCRWTASACRRAPAVGRRHEGLRRKSDGVPVPPPVRAHDGVAQRLARAGARAWRRPRGRRRARAGAARSTGRRRAGEGLPRELSGGEAQRVAIARALAVDPPPPADGRATASLDPARRDELGDTLRRLTASGRTLLPRRTTTASCATSPIASSSWRTGGVSKKAPRQRCWRRRRTRRRGSCSASSRGWTGKGSRDERRPCDANRALEGQPLRRRSRRRGCDGGAARRAGADQGDRQRVDAGADGVELRAGQVDRGPVARAPGPVRVRVRVARAHGARRCLLHRPALRPGRLAVARGGHRRTGGILGVLRHAAPQPAAVRDAEPGGPPPAADASRARPDDRRVGSRVARGHERHHLPHFETIAGS